MFQITRSCPQFKSLFGLCISLSVANLHAAWKGRHCCLFGSFSISSCRFTSCKPFLSTMMTSRLGT
eukprot:29413_4